MTEQSRAQPNTPNRSQRELPIAVVEQSDEAYLAALESADLPDGVTAIVRYIITQGRRQAGEMRLPVRTQRQIAYEVKHSASTVCESLKRLRISGLVTKADGDYRLRLALLVEISEVAQTRRQEARPEVDPEAAWEVLVGCGARPRSACSAALGTTSVTVEEEDLYSVFEPVPTSVHRTGSVANSRTDRAPDEAAQIGLLKGMPEWQRLQSGHLRPALDFGLLDQAFRAACEVSLLRESDREAWFTHCYDVSRNRKLNSPVACLMKRVVYFRTWRLNKDYVGLARKLIQENERCTTPSF